MSQKTFRWGILGTGNIARLIASDLQLLPDAELVAVGSRSQERADAFADEFEVSQRFSSYEDVVTDGAVDVVHVATPHSGHVDHATTALEAGCAVLCEKPMALNVDRATDLIETARSEDQFLMEGMWTRFLPVMDDVRRVVSEEALGDVQQFRADIGLVQSFDPEHRLYAPELGGGALLDLGVYPIAMTLDLFGAPDSVVSTAEVGKTGVDEQCTVVFEYDSDLQAAWQASIRGDMGRTCAISGNEGRLQGRRSWWKGAPYDLSLENGTEATFARPFEGNGYQFELAHVMRCLREGRTESPVMPHEDSRSILQITDALRREWGVRYPEEG